MATDESRDDPLEGCDLRVQEQASLKAVEYSPDSKIIVNSRGTIIVFNSRAEFIFGYDRSDVIGHPLSLLLPDGIKGPHESLFQAFLRNPAKRTMGETRALKARHRDGTEFAVRIELSPFTIPGAGIHVMAVVRRKEGVEWAQEALEALEVQDALEAQEKLQQHRALMTAQTDTQAQESLSVVKESSDDI